MKKLIILLFISFVSCNHDNKDEVVKNEVIKEINSSQIPAVVMGKIYNNGKMEFFQMDLRAGTGMTQSMKTIFLELHL